MNRARIWLAAGEAMQAIKGILGLAIIVAAQGIAAYGQVVFAQALAVVAAPLVGLGIAQGIVVNFAGRDWTQHARRSMRRAILAAAGGSLAGAVIAWLAWHAAGASHHALGAAALVASTAFMPVALQAARARGMDTLYGAARGIEAVASLGVLVLLANNVHVGTLMFAIGVGRMVVATVVMAWVHGPEPAARGAPHPTPLGTGWPLILPALGLWLVAVGDRVVLGAMSDAATVGAFGALAAAAALLSSAAAPWHLPLYPAIVRLARQERWGAAANQVAGSQRAVVYWFVPATIIGGMLLGSALRLIGVPTVTAWVGIALLLAAFAHRIGFPAQYVLEATGRRKDVQKAWMLAAAGNLILAVPATLWFGPLGTAASTLMVQLGLATHLIATQGEVARRHFVPRAMLVQATAASGLATAVVVGTWGMPEGLLDAVGWGAAAGGIYLFIMGAWRLLASRRHLREGPRGEEPNAPGLAEGPRGRGTPTRR